MLFQEPSKKRVMWLLGILVVILVGVMIVAAMRFRDEMNGTPVTDTVVSLPPKTDVDNGPTDAEIRAQLEKLNQAEQTVSPDAAAAPTDAEIRKQLDALSKADPAKAEPAPTDADIRAQLEKLNRK